MYIIIAGGGRTSVYLARVLLRQDHTVRVLEFREDVISNLHRELPTEVIVQAFHGSTGIGTCRLRKADVFAAVTTKDKTIWFLYIAGRNLMSAEPFPVNNRYCRFW